MNYEKIQESYFVDIFRITNGTLLYVKKYERDLNFRGPIYGEKCDKHTKIVRGCKGLKLFKKDYTYYDYYSKRDITIPAGTFLLNQFIVIPTVKENFKFEIKTNEVIRGTKEDMKKVFQNVNEIMDSYY